MRFFEKDYTNYDGETKTLKLRLVSSDMKTIEKKTGVKLIDYISDYSITMITNILMYMNRPNTPNFSSVDAENLYDELIDSGLTLEDIYQDIIMETLVVSGFMKKEDLDQMKKTNKDNKDKKMEELKQGE